MSRHTVLQSGKFCRFSGAELSADYFSDERDTWTEYYCSCSVHKKIAERTATINKHELLIRAIDKEIEEEKIKTMDNGQIFKNASRKILDTLNCKDGKAHDFVRLSKALIELYPEVVTYRPERKEQ